MALTLEQYAAFLDTRDVNWPAPPPVQPPKAKPHLAVLPDIRLVGWNVYGTLLSIFSGNLCFVHPEKLGRAYARANSVSSCHGSNVSRSRVARVHRAAAKELEHRPVPDQADGSR